MIDTERLRRARHYDDEGKYLRDARSRTGRYTATDSGAYSLAARREAMRNNKEVMGASKSQEDFERLISGKGVK